MKHEQERLVRITTASELFDVPPTTLKHWVKKGRLTKYRMGRNLRVSLRELCALVTVESRASEPATA